MSLMSDFAEIRRVSTPWVAVRTNDWRSTFKSLQAVRLGSEDAPPAILWTVTDGPQSIGDCPQLNIDADPLLMQYGSPATLACVLRQARQVLPGGAICYVLVPDNEFFANPITAQAISDLRDDFKSTNRTLVLLGIDPKLPPFLAEDIPILDDPLPTEGDLANIAASLITSYEEGAGCKIAKPAQQAEQAARVCLGLPAFPAEEVMSRKLRKSGYDMEALAVSRRSTIEQASTGALKFDRERVNFDQIGGYRAFKALFLDIQNGPSPVSLVVRLDEVDKAISAAASGAVADNTGVSQDMLRCLLTGMEDNNWMGLLAAGCPGSGKTLSSTCLGGQFGIEALSMDLGAMKGSLVGQSEANIRRSLATLLAIGGKNVLFFATANRLDTLPPELRRRFWLGTWFWDMPTPEEKAVIWPIQRKKFNVPAGMKQPCDTDWTGSDIRDACRMAWVCKCTLEQAAERITVSGIASKASTELLRDKAEKEGFRSASTAGGYKRPVKSSSRKLNMN